MIENAESWTVGNFRRIMLEIMIERAISNTHFAILYARDPEVKAKLNLAEDVLRGALEKLRDEHGGSVSAASTGEGGQQ